MTRKKYLKRILLREVIMKIRLRNTAVFYESTLKLLVLNIISYFPIKINQNSTHFFLTCFKSFSPRTWDLYSIHRKTE